MTADALPEIAAQAIAAAVLQACADLINRFADENLFTHNNFIYVNF